MAWLEFPDFGWAMLSSYEGAEATHLDNVAFQPSTHRSGSLRPPVIITNKPMKEGVLDRPGEAV